MRELTIKEKAEAYDKALQKARQLCAYPTSKPFISDLQDLFPELAESEDERTRKAILEHIRYCTESIPDRDKFVAWLEKQDYTFEIKRGHWYKCVCDYMLNSSDLMFKNGRLYYCRSDWRLGGEIDERNVKDIGVNGYKSFFRPATNQEIKDWLEKQGEQRSKLIDFDLNANDSELQEETYFIPKDFHAEIDGDKVVIKKGEQQPAGVEPKFKVGDWIVLNGLTLLVNEVAKGYYRTISINGIKNSYDWYFDNVARLWTIQDAKAGDVLVCGVNQRPFIFKGLLDPYHPNCPVAYCGIDTEGNCYVSKDNTWWTDCNVMPATKEQCDTLKKAMADAGYTFDFEKKELSKIEQKPEERESCEHWDDEQTRIKLLSFLNIWGKAKLPLTSVNRFVNYLEKQGKQKPWSEEDEKKITYLDDLVGYQSCLSSDEKKDFYRWFKSLKDRVQTQPKQEWNEEDKEQLVAAINIVADSGHTCTSNWLKSFKER